MQEVGMHEAKTRLSELVRLVQGGEAVFLTSRGQVVAELVAPKQLRKKNAAATLKRLKRLIKTAPLGSYDEVMRWRREGL